MTDDRWKAIGPDVNPLLSKEHLQVDLAETEKDIAWNERRLGYLVLSDEDRQQTADLIDELRGYRAKLLGMLTQ